MLFNFQSMYTLDYALSSEERCILHVQGQKKASISSHERVYASKWRDIIILPTTKIFKHGGL